jgi:hypothetical protein
MGIEEKEIAHVNSSVKLNYYTPSEFRSKRVFPQSGITRTYLYTNEKEHETGKVSDIREVGKCGRVK